MDNWHSFIFSLNKKGNFESYCVIKSSKYITVLDHKIGGGEKAIKKNHVHF